MRTMILSATVVFLLGRCATVEHGPMQRISVGSNPQGASVRLDDCGFGSTDSAKTPAIVFVNRRATQCTVTFTHPAHGSRTVSLFRTERPYPVLSDMAVKGGQSLIVGAWEALASSPDESALVIALPVVGVGAAAMAIGGTLGRIDGIAGANYRQNRSVVLVDFDNPIPDVAGRYSLENVNGKELPTQAWTTRYGKCLIYANSGSLVLEENGRWTSVVTEQAFCGYNAAMEIADQGVYSVDADRILLESEGGVTVGVLEDDQIELTIRRPGSPEGPTAIYKRRRRQ